MKIVFLTRLFHPHIGGVEKHVEKLAQVLIKKGYQITVLTEQYESSLNLEDRYKDIQIYRIPRDIAKSKLTVWKWIKHKQQLFETSDIVHAHDVFWWYLPTKFRLNTPVYTTFHGWEGAFPPTFKAKMWRKIAEKMSLGTICVGDFIHTWYGTNPNVVTYGATDQTLLPGGDKNRLLILGRLSHDNDIEKVIEAIVRIQQNIPKLKVTFLGDGELAWEARKVGVVLGFQENISEYLQENHWVVASSYLAMLDAVAAGRTVYSVYSNPLKEEYLKSHPLATSVNIAGTSQELYNQFMYNYQQKPEHTEIINKSQKWATQQTWEKLANHYIKLWEDHSYTFAYNKLNLEL